MKRGRHWLSLCSASIQGFLLLLIFFYQRLISPLLAPRCRFYPSCSEYSRVCLQKYRLLPAIIKIVYRILRCNPFHSGGVDEP